MGYFRLFTSLSIFTRQFSGRNSEKIMKYLNVAEKNDAAKNIATILSHGNSSRREGLSPYNKIYEFSTKVLGADARMVMTSVSGHLLNYEFTTPYRQWRACNPLTLFDAPVMKTCPDTYQPIKKTLEREIRSCQGLIIWTDCDREGENIGYEIIKVCTDIKPDLRIYRAKFSEITATSIFRALQLLGQPDKNVSDAVDVRQELDLRTGAAFTRLQTLRLQKVFPGKLMDKLISYGSCQFPTLGFVVERYQQIENFIPEPFWKIKMNHTIKGITTEFNWKRDRLFDKNACEAILDICQEHSEAIVEKIENKSKSKWRPLPLDTIEMEKTVSKKLKINAKETMKIAEKLYTQGLISYPRTETNIFPKELNLTNLVTQQLNDQIWGGFAQRVLDEGGPTPRQGKKNDKAHPPIHPIKYTTNLNGNEKRLYEYIVRHFLACLHKDAIGHETTIHVDLAEEKFTAKGLCILKKNYLDIYIYEKWTDKEIYNYSEGERFTPTVLEMIESTTSPPKLLTESDLIALMDKNGIGTDATHAEHIDTIKTREYVGLHENIYFVPGTLGMGLVEGYNSMDLEVSLAKPLLRAEFENDLKLICDGVKNADTVRIEQIAKYRALFRTVVERMEKIDEMLGRRLDERPEFVNDAALPTDGADSNAMKPIMKCPKCQNDMVLNLTDGRKFISCVGYPACRNAIWFGDNTQSIQVLDQICPNCGPPVCLLKFKFRQNLFPGEPNPNVLCIGGCDLNVLEALNIPVGNVKNLGTRANQVRASNDRVSNQMPTNGTPSTNQISPRNRTMTLSANDEILCSCHNEAVQLTVRKDGPNKGRKFYKCASGACQFFLWASETSNSNNITTNTTMDTSINNGTTTEIKCHCHQLAALKTVSKQGPNVGRQFYCCAKPMGHGCNFFKWKNDGGGDGSRGGGGGDDPDGGGGGGGGDVPGPSNWRGKTKTKTDPKMVPYKNQTKTKRKCGLCGVEGHTRTKCPNK